ncbi:hypothetical protein KC725_05625 [Candidatus Peregrinibacteria bacterium]|nr:hypothetical protein [Candidatus Peregrinibacteria bacterium]
MGFFDFLYPYRRIKGEIGYFGLSEWWLSSFSEKERAHILKTFKPLGLTISVDSLDDNSLISGEIESTTQTAVGLLSALAGWFASEEDRTIAYRILKKAEELIGDEINILDQHFFYQSKIQIYYRHRNRDSEGLSIARQACRQQIRLAPQAAIAFRKEYANSPLPCHVGYEQLAIIYEKEKKYNSVIELARKAKSQGWNGDWEKRIARCKKKLLQ